MMAMVMVMMVAYSIMGAFVFQFLEASHEVASDRHIKDIREHRTEVGF